MSILHYALIAVCSYQCVKNTGYFLLGVGLFFSSVEDHTLIADGEKVKVTKETILAGCDVYFVLSVAFGVLVYFLVT